MNRNVHVPFLGEGQRQRCPLTRLRAVVPKRLACRGTHVGRVAVRARGYFSITTKQGKITDVPHRFCQLIGRSNGYSYQPGERHAATPPPSA
jgi:hypothetical protein